MKTLYTCTPPHKGQTNRHFMFTMAREGKGSSVWADDTGVKGFYPCAQVCVPALCMPTNKRDRDRKLSEVFRKLNGEII